MHKKIALSPLVFIIPAFVMISTVLVAATVMNKDGNDIRSRAFMSHEDIFIKTCKSAGKSHAECQTIVSEFKRGTSTCDMIATQFKSVYQTQLKTACKQTLEATPIADIKRNCITSCKMEAKNARLSDAAVEDPANNNKECMSICNDLNSKIKTCPSACNGMPNSARFASCSITFCSPGSSTRQNSRVRIFQNIPVQGSCMTGLKMHTLNSKCGTPSSQSHTSIDYTCWDGTSGTYTDGAKCLNDVSLRNRVSQLCKDKSNCTPTNTATPTPTMTVAPPTADDDCTTGGICGGG